MEKVKIFTLTVKGTEWIKKEVGELRINSGGTASIDLYMFPDLSLVLGAKVQIGPYKTKTIQIEEEGGV